MKTDTLLKRNRAVEMFTGLSLIFNIMQDEYISDFTEGAGIRVVVHDQREMPFPENNGIAVNPGHLTYIGATAVSLSLISSITLSSPYQFILRESRGK